ncbi:MAG TPA: cation/multidrug efflux pump [Gammaproteobacteria bacterium]|nr:cation/multidrug efflux pump [Gammaproteobacteria bacterium]
MSHLELAAWIVCAVFIVLGLVGLGLLLVGFKRLVKLRLVSGSGRVLVGLVLVLAAAFLAALLLDLRTYLALTAERPVATLAFSKLGPQHFTARLTDAGGQTTETDLHGDQWELDARVIVWKGYATVLGLPTLYRLDRLSGRYANIGQEQHDPHSAVALNASAGLDAWSLLHRHPGWLPWMDASYGSGVFLPMADGARYQVSLSRTGLMARPINVAAAQAVEQWQ